MSKEKGSRRNMVVIIIILIFIVLVLLSFISRNGLTIFQPGIETVEKNQSGGLLRIEELHKNLDSSALEEIKGIIKNSPDPYTRERAVFVLVDIGMRKNVTDEVIDFLKDVAINEKNDEVRTAAYANLDLIREEFPPNIQGDLEVRIDGEIKKGNNISVILGVSSNQNVDAIAGIKRVADLENETDEIKVPGIKVLEKKIVYLTLDNGEYREAKFTIFLEETGNYQILTAVKLSVDRVDYVKIEKSILLTVNDDSGTYEIVPGELNPEQGFQDASGVY